MSESDFWVFGYGSLMWEPGFAHRHAESALLRGYHRRFAIYSYESWGSPRSPGLVLTLMPGGACRGMAYLVPRAARPEVLAYLDRRENAYHRREVPVTVNGTMVPAITYVANAAHPRFAGRLADHAAARLIAQGVGNKGSSLDYLRGTVRHLEAWGIGGTACHRLLELAETLREP